MNKLKKYAFLWILTAFGIIYLSVTDSWQVYAGPIDMVKQWVTQKGDFAGQGENVQEEVEEEISWPDTGENDNAADNGENDGTADAGGMDSVFQPEMSVSGGESPIPPSPSVPELETSRSPEEVKYLTVEDSYFSDAVFIGDSRTVGMFEYGGLEKISTFYASTGLTVYKLFDSPVVKVAGQKEKQTIEEALQENSFSKIYLMIGINEMGTGTVETFIEKYKEVIAHLQELQPGAVIYIQGIMKVTTERSNQGDYITNEGIEERNAELAKLADYVQVYYLDVNPLICDETGGMEPSYTFDGVHLKAQYISIWKDFLKTHAVDVEPV